MSGQPNPGVEEVGNMAQLIKLWKNKDLSLDPSTHDSAEQVWNLSVTPVFQTVEGL